MVPTSGPRSHAFTAAPPQSQVGWTWGVVSPGPRLRPTFPVLCTGKRWSPLFAGTPLSRLVKVGVNPRSKYDRSRTMPTSKRTPLFFGLLWFSLTLLCQNGLLYSSERDPLSFFACSRQKQILQTYLFGKNIHARLLMSIYPFRSEI